MNNVSQFHLEQQICFRSPEAAQPLIERLNREQVDACIDYERTHSNRLDMLCMLQRQRVAALLAEAERNPLVVMTTDQAEQLRAALNAARSHIQCGAPAGVDVHAELGRAVQMIDASIGGNRS